VSTRTASEQRRLQSVFEGCAGTCGTGPVEASSSERSAQLGSGWRRRRHIHPSFLRDPERATVFTDAQAAIRRMASQQPGPGPGQMYALQARKHIAVLRRAMPDITIEIRWRSAHKGVPETRRPTNGPKARGGGARRPRGGMVKLFGPDGSARDAALPIPRTPRAGDYGEVVGGSPTMGWRPDLQEARNAEEPETGRHGGWEFQEACLKVLPTEDRSLPLRAIPHLAEESAHSSAGGADAGRRPGITSSSRCVPHGRHTRRSRGQRCRRRVGGGRVGAGSGTALPTGGAARRY